MLTSTSQTKAQIIPSGSPGVFQQSAGPFPAIPADDIVVNCDMIETGNSGNDALEAIVFARHGCSTCTSLTSQGNIFIEDYTYPWGGNPNLTVALPGHAEEPDVANAYFIDSKGILRTQVAVVWMDNGDAYFQVWEIGGIGTGTLTATPVAKFPQKLNATPGGSWGTPHIDMFVDPNNPINGVASIKDYAIIYTDGPSHAMKIYYGDLNNSLFAPTGNTILTTNSYMPDIACLTDYTTGTNDNFAYVCYGNGATGSLDVFEFNTSSGTPTGNVFSQPGVSIFSPRIEAMNQYYGGQAKWQVVTCEMSASNYQVVGYNDLTVGATQLSSGLFSAQDIKAPCVAAAMGPAVFGYAGSDVGNVQYTAGFFPWLGTDLYVRDIDASSGALASTFYYQVNDPHTPVNYPWDAGKHFAISSSTNLGLEFLSAWADGTDIMYKHSPNAHSPMAFRQPTAVNVIHNAFAPVYPNPAKNEIHFGAEAKSSFLIQDITGRTVKSGVAASDNTVDVGNLKAGIYILRRITSGDISETVKFSKL